MRAEIEQLAAEHLVAVEYEPGCRPRIELAGRRVLVPPVEDDESYRIALAQIAELVAVAELVALTRERMLALQ